MATSNQVLPETLISVKVQFGAENRRFKLPFKDLGSRSLPEKLRALLVVPASQILVLERYSDSAGAYVRLDSNNVSVYKQLARAAKAKLKLRIKATIIEGEENTQTQPLSEVNVQSNIETSQEKLLQMNTETLNDAQNITKSPEEGSKLYELNNMSGATLKPMALPKHSVPAVTTRNLEEEAPLPKPFSDDNKLFQDLEKLANQADTAKLYSKDQSFPVSLNAFTVHCNNCSEYIPGTHWHCGTCEAGDFDLCLNCYDRGDHCEDDSHYLIKRVIKNGKIINSTSELATRKTLPEKEVPGAFKSEAREIKTHAQVMETRTCNNCVNVFSEDQLVTCLNCDDWDLCLSCLISKGHGHHPGHQFTKIVSSAQHNSTIEKLCSPGRNIRHYATCDGCDKTIYGIRHKCATCPDWDFCDVCVKSARHIHPTHRFIPIYDAISIPTYSQVEHPYIKCDGPLCVNREGHITGDRYKCSVCYDTDFCSNCEALPTNPHNRTHPLIKFRTPVQSVAVTTYNANEDGVTSVLGDRPPRTSSKSTETSPIVASTNKATQVQTVAEVRPVESIKEKPAEETPEVQEEEKGHPTFFATQLEANFVRDSVPDGSSLPATTLVQQVWTVRNPGPLPWPAGCSVRYIGGDRMLNLDIDRPSTLSEIDNAVSSNTIDREVLPSEEVQFQVTIKTPSRLGRAISYWRLKTKEGVPFGHKLWCDIDVIESPVAVAEADNHVKDEPSTGKTEQELSESQMIFPKLEKESPASSTHEAAPYVAPAAASVATANDVQEAADDLENLELEDSDTEDGFLTDEEYEILDAEANEEASNGKK